MVLEIISGGKSMAEAYREFSLKADLLSHWKAQFLDNAAKVFATATEAKPQQARIAELERLASKQGLEMEILKKSVETLAPNPKEKRELSRQMVWEYPKAVVCRVLGAVRSNHYYVLNIVDKSLLEEEIRGICAPDLPFLIYLPPCVLPLPWHWWARSSPNGPAQP